MRWGLESELLGRGETGMEMDDEASRTMQLPAPRNLVEYLEDAFAALEGQLHRISDEQMAAGLEDFYGRDTNVGAYLLNHLSHMDRHLGMIEALLGAAGLKGSATV